MLGLARSLPLALLLLLPGCGRSALTLGNGGTAGETSGAETLADSGEGDDAVCGDGVVSGGEDCDGSDLGGRSCEDFGFSGGALSCSSQCSFDATGCTDGADTGWGDGDGDGDTGPTTTTTGPGDGDGDTGPTTGDGDGDPNTCGNGILDGDEECDGADFGGLNCADLGFGPGLPLCTADCTLDTSTCPENSAEGDPCNGWNEPCPDGYACVMGTCWDGSPGDPCNGDMDCASNDCVQMGMWGDGSCA